MSESRWNVHETFQTIGILVAIFMAGWSLVDDRNDELADARRERCDAIEEAVQLYWSGTPGNRDFLIVKLTNLEDEKPGEKSIHCPEEVELKVVHGLLCVEGGDFFLARAYFEEALEHERDSLRGKIGLAKALMETATPDRQRDHYQKALQLLDEARGAVDEGSAPAGRSERTSILMLRAQALATLGRLSDARVAVQEALRFPEAQRDPQAHLLLGHVERLDGRHSAAADSYLAAYGESEDKDFLGYYVDSLAAAGKLCDEIEKIRNAAGSSLAQDTVRRDPLVLQALRVAGDCPGQ